MHIYDTKKFLCVQDSLQGDLDLDHQHRLLASYQGDFPFYQGGPSPPPPTPTLLKTAATVSSRLQIIYDK